MIPAPCNNWWLSFTDEEQQRRRRQSRLANQLFLFFLFFFFDSLVLFFLVLIFWGRKWGRAELLKIRLLPHSFWQIELLGVRPSKQTAALTLWWQWEVGGQRGGLEGSKGISQSLLICINSNATRTLTTSLNRSTVHSPSLYSPPTPVGHLSLGHVFWASTSESI